MKRLRKRSSDIESLYQTMCEAVAEDLKDIDDLALGDFAKETIQAIQNQQFLSDFEKTVRDYFKEKKLALVYETLASDIGKFL